MDGSLRRCLFQPSQSSRRLWLRPYWVTVATFLAYVFHISLVKCDIWTVWTTLLFHFNFGCVWFDSWLCFFLLALSLIVLDNSCYRAPPLPHWVRHLAIPSSAIVFLRFLILRSKIWMRSEKHLCFSSFDKLGIEDIWDFILQANVHPRNISGLSLHVDQSLVEDCIVFRVQFNRV